MKASHTRRHQATFATLLCLAILTTTLPTPAHALWGLLGKAAGAAGKAGTAGKAAGAAGKVAVAGAAAEGAAEAGLLGKGAAAAAQVGDDAGRVGNGLGTGLAGNAAHTANTPHGLGAIGSVNAALPPEVAAYLAKPAKSLSVKDTAGMMTLYRKMMTQVGKSGDFTSVEKMAQMPAANIRIATKNAVGNEAGMAKASAPAADKTATSSTPGTTSGTPSGTHYNPATALHALLLLSHAARAGNHEAQRELQRICVKPAPAPAPAPVAGSGPGSAAPRTVSGAPAASQPHTPHLGPAKDLCAL